MNIVVVNGCGSSGKDTFENFVIEIAKEDNKKVYKTSIINYVKHCAGMLGWEGGKTDKDRKFLADLKSALTNWNDSPRRSIKEDIEFCQEDSVDLLFIDMREIEDIEWLKSEYHIISLLVDREINRKYGNAADDGVMDITYDIVIKNIGSLEDLKASAEVFWNNIINKKG